MLYGVANTANHTYILDRHKIILLSQRLILCLTIAIKSVGQVRNPFATRRHLHGIMQQTYLAIQVILH